MHFISAISVLCGRELIKERGLSDPNWFFQTLLEKPYLNNVIISPHYYPPTVSKSKSQCAWSQCLQCFSLPVCKSQAACIAGKADAVRCPAAASLERRCSGG